MKKQINPNVKAHLVRGAFYLLLLLAVCVIPFALAQQTTAKGNRPATTITVTNGNDSGSGSLRQALAGANDGDTIQFDSALNGQTITLTSGELVVADSITISGPGPTLLAVSRDSQTSNFRILHIQPNHTVAISGLTISNGSLINLSGAGIF